MWFSFGFVYFSQFLGFPFRLSSEKIHFIYVWIPFTSCLFSWLESSSLFNFKVPSISEFYIIPQTLSNYVTLFEASSEILNSVLMSFTCLEILACAFIRPMYYCAHKVFADNIGEVSEEVVIMKTVCEHSSVFGSALRWISVIATCFWSFNLKSLYALMTMLVRLHLWAFHPSCRFWYGTWGKPSISFSLLNWSLEHWCVNLVMWLLFMYWKFVAIGSNLELH